MRRKILVVAGSILVVLAVGLLLITQRDHGKNERVTAVSGDPATCPDPLVLTMPVEEKLVTSMLWPGQERGGDFKAHGGFRFDGSQADDITVRAPLDARLTDASRYLEGGDEQYLLFFETDCGVSFRFDHLFNFSPKLAAALKDLPPAKPNDSRTTRITELVTFAAGEELAHSVGSPSRSNIFVDFGLYETRPDGADGLCFFDYLPADLATRLKNLPTGNEGKHSTFCSD